MLVFNKTVLRTMKRDISYLKLLFLHCISEYCQESVFQTGAVSQIKNSYYYSHLQKDILAIDLIQ